MILRTICTSNLKYVFVSIDEQVVYHVGCTYSASTTLHSYLFVLLLAPRFQGTRDG